MLEDTPHKVGPIPDKVGPTSLAGGADQPAPVTPRVQLLECSCTASLDCIYTIQQGWFDPRAKIHPMRLYKQGQTSPWKPKVRSLDQGLESIILISYYGS
jgi:hypothetical protein